MRNLNLKSKEISFLKEFMRKGQTSARSFKRASVLFLLDKKETGNAIAEKLNVDIDTVYNIKRRYLRGGIQGALFDKPRPGQPVKYDTNKKTEIIAYACTNPPKGRKRWTVRLLAKEISKERGFETINRETIRLILKKTIPSLG